MVYRLNQGASLPKDASLQALGHCRNDTEAQWMIFLSRCRIPFVYHKEKDKEAGGAGPDFTILEGGPDLAILSRQEGRDRFGESLLLQVPYVEETGRPLLVCFGAPKIRLPEPQGWLLSRKENGKVDVMPGHIVEDTGRLGFSLMCVGAAAARLEGRGCCTPLQQMSPPSKMEAAYLAASHHSLWSQ